MGKHSRQSKNLPIAAWRKNVGEYSPKARDPLAELYRTSREVRKCNKQTQRFKNSASSGVDASPKYSSTRHQLYSRGFSITPVSTLLGLIGFAGVIAAATQQQALNSQGNSAVLGFDSNLSPSNFSLPLLSSVVVQPEIIPHETVSVLVGHMAELKSELYQRRDLANSEFQAIELKHQKHLKSLGEYIRKNTPALIQTLALEPSLELYQTASAIIDLLLPEALEREDFQLHRCLGDLANALKDIQLLEQLPVTKLPALVEVLFIHHDLKSLDSPEPLRRIQDLISIIETTPKMQEQNQHFTQLIQSALFNPQKLNRAMNHFGVKESMTAGLGFWSAVEEKTENFSNIIFSSQTLYLLKYQEKTNELNLTPALEQELNFFMASFQLRQTIRSVPKTLSAKTKFEWIRNISQEMKALEQNLPEHVFFSILAKEYRNIFSGAQTVSIDIDAVLMDFNAAGPEHKSYFWQKIMLSNSNRLDEIQKEINFNQLVQNQSLQNEMLLDFFSSAFSQNLKTGLQYSLSAQVEQGSLFLQAIDEAWSAYPNRMLDSAIIGLKEKFSITRIMPSGLEQAPPQEQCAHLIAVYRYLVLTRTNSKELNRLKTVIMPILSPFLKGKDFELLPMAGAEKNLTGMELCFLGSLLGEDVRQGLIKFLPGLKQQGEAESSLYFSIFSIHWGLSRDNGAGLSLEKFIARMKAWTILDLDQIASAANEALNPEDSLAIITWVRSYLVEGKVDSSKTHPAENKRIQKILAQHYQQSSGIISSGSFWFDQLCRVSFLSQPENAKRDRVLFTHAYYDLFYQLHLSVDYLRDTPYTGDLNLSLIFNFRAVLFQDLSEMQWLMLYFQLGNLGRDGLTREQFKVLHDSFRNDQYTVFSEKVQQMQRDQIKFMEKVSGFFEGISSRAAPPNFPSGPGMDSHRAEYFPPDTEIAQIPDAFKQRDLLAEMDSRMSQSIISALMEQALYAKDERLLQHFLALTKSLIDLRNPQKERSQAYPELIFVLYQEPLTEEVRINIEKMYLFLEPEQKRVLTHLLVIRLALNKNLAVSERPIFESQNAMLRRLLSEDNNDYLITLKNEKLNKNEGFVYISRVLYLIDVILMDEALLIQGRLFNDLLSSFTRLSSTVDSLDTTPLILIANRTLLLLASEPYNPQFDLPMKELLKKVLQNIEQKSPKTGTVFQRMLKKQSENGLLNALGVGKALLEPQPFKRALAQLEQALDERVLGLFSAEPGFLLELRSWVRENSQEEFSKDHWRIAILRVHQYLISLQGDEALATREFKKALQPLSTIIALENRVKEFMEALPVERNRCLYKLYGAYQHCIESFLELKETKVSTETAFSRALKNIMLDHFSLSFALIGEGDYEYIDHRLNLKTDGSEDSNLSFLGGISAVLVLLYSVYQFTLFRNRPQKGKEDLPPIRPGVVQDSKKPMVAIQRPVPDVLYFQDIPSKPSKLISGIDRLNKKTKIFSREFIWEEYSQGSKQGFVLRFSEENSVPIFQTTIEVFSMMHLLRHYYLTITSLPNTSIFLEDRSLKILGTLKPEIFLNIPIDFQYYRNIVNIFTQLKERYSPAQLRLISLTQGQEHGFGVTVSFPENADTQKISREDFMECVYQDLYRDLGVDVFLQGRKIITNQLPSEDIFKNKFSPKTNQEKSQGSAQSGSPKKKKDKQEKVLRREPCSSVKKKPIVIAASSSEASSSSGSSSTVKRRWLDPITPTFFSNDRQEQTAKDHLNQAIVYLSMLKENAAGQMIAQKGKNKAMGNEVRHLRAYMYISKFLTELHEYHKIIKNQSSKIERGKSLMPLRIYILRQCMQPEFCDFIEKVEAQLSTLDWDMENSVRVFNPDLISDSKGALQSNLVQLRLSAEEADKRKNDILFMMQELNQSANKSKIPQTAKEKIQFWGSLGNQTDRIEFLMIAVVELSKVLKEAGFSRMIPPAILKMIDTEVKPLRNQIVHAELSPIAIVDFIFSQRRLSEIPEQSAGKWKGKEKMVEPGSLAGPSGSR